MDEPSWRDSLNEAIERHAQLPASRFVQVATIRPGGRPAVRTMVFRGFVGGSLDLAFATDVRSGKVVELAALPFVELCWYFTETREQFRLGGTAFVVGTSSGEQPFVSARRDVWRELSDEARTAYTWPEPGHQRDVQVAFPSRPSAATEPHANFGLLLVRPTEVDHLELGPQPQRRRVFRLDEHGRWTCREVNP